MRSNDCKNVFILHQTFSFQIINNSISFMRSLVGRHIFHSSLVFPRCKPISLFYCKRSVELQAQFHQFRILGIKNTKLFQCYGIFSNDKRMSYSGSNFARTSAFQYTNAYLKAPMEFLLRKLSSAPISSWYLRLIGYSFRRQSS